MVLKFRPSMGVRRRGSMYMVALGAAMVVTVLGLSALMTVRIERKSADAAGDLAEARLLAQSAIEMGVWMMNDDPTWRSTLTSGNWKTNQPLGRGTFSLDGFDPMDADLADSKTEPVELTGTGLVGDARFIVKATATAEATPLGALSRALTADGNLSVLSGATFTSPLAALRTNAQLINSGTIIANVEIGSVRTLGTVVGTVTTGSTALEMPDPDVFAMYQSLATTIAYPGTTFDRVLLAPGLNPWGATNADGVYFIDAGSNDLTIKRSRVLGTLLVKCGTSNKLVIDDPMFMQPYRADYPVLIADCAVEIKLTSAVLVLSESLQLTNYNPTVAVYLGIGDIDLLDTYPNEIQGLVHAKRNLKLDLTTRIRGSVICEGTVTASSADIIYTASLLTSPPMGYSSYHMAISPGSWERVVLP